MRKQRQKGFTLLELLIVITIIGILAGITIISYPGISQKAKLANAIKFSDNVRGSLQPDMVAWWKFDETLGTIAKDSWWNEFHGTVVGATWVEGIKGNALSFDGNDYVDFGTDSCLTPQSATIEVWIKPSAFSQWAGIISNMTAWGTGLSLQIGTVHNISAMVSGTYLSTSWSPQLETWYHILITHNNSNNLNILYVNGKEENRSIRAVNYEANAKTYIGVFYTTPSLYFRGLIDDVQIYSAALPLSMIQQHYAEGLKTHQNLAKR